MIACAGAVSVSVCVRVWVSVTPDICFLISFLFFSSPFLILMGFAFVRRGAANAVTITNINNNNNNYYY